MSRRSSILILIGAVTGCLLLTICLGVIGGAYYLSFSNTNPLAALPFNTSASLNRIVFVGNDFNIYVADPENGTSSALTTDGGTDHAYNFPVWSPDNRRLAFVGYTFQNGNPTEGALYTISPTGENLTPVYKTTENFPFYLYWAPDSQVISFLANKDSQTIALNIARSDQPDSKQEVDSGSPFYWAWAPDSSQMFTHVGGTRSDSSDARLALLPFKGTDARRALEASPGQFQAPQWSSQGNILYSTQNGSEQTIALADASGKEITKLATYRGRASFTLAPDGTDIAYLLTEPETRIANYGPLRVVDSNGKNVRVVSQEPVLAFLWSPDATKLAYLTLSVENQSNFNFDVPPGLSDPPKISNNLPYSLPSRSMVSNTPEKFLNAPTSNQGGEAQVQLHWQVWDRAADSSRIVATFVPTLSFINVIPYFDQYANSSTFWSPDSKSLVYTTLETESNGAVFIADVVGSNPPRKIGDGVIAYWSWK
jgi:TolB protein